MSAAERSSLELNITYLTKEKMNIPPSTSYIILRNGKINCMKAKRPILTRTGVKGRRFRG